MCRFARPYCATISTDPHCKKFLVEAWARDIVEKTRQEFDLFHQLRAAPARKYCRSKREYGGESHYELVTSHL